MSSTDEETQQFQVPDTGEQASAPAEDMEKLEREKERLTAIAQRAQADLVNFRRRVEQERQEDRLRETRRFGLLVLEVLDQLETALDSAPAGAAKEWRQGLEAVRKNFQGVVEQEGFQRIDALKSPFNPQEHDALVAQPSKAHAEGEIISQIRPGYRHKGAVIRPAQVIIAAPPEEGGGEARPARNRKK